MDNSGPINRGSAVSVKVHSPISNANIVVYDQGTGDVITDAVDDECEETLSGSPNRLRTQESGVLALCHKREEREGVLPGRGTRP